MSKKFWALVTTVAFAALASTAAVYADDEAPAQAAGKLSPPPIHEPFAGPNLPPCDKGNQTTPGLEACVAHEILRSDRRIDELNSSISSGLGNARMQREFVAAHRAWLAYRNADCSSVSSIYEGGTLQPLALAHCLEDRNERRLRDLRDFSRGPEG